MFDLSLKAKVTSSAIIKHKFSLQINKKNLTSLLCLHIILKKLKTEYMNIWCRSTDYKTCLFGSYLMFFLFSFFFIQKKTGRALLLWRFLLMEGEPGWPGLEVAEVGAGRLDEDVDEGACCWETFCSSAASCFGSTPGDLGGLSPVKITLRLIPASVQFFCFNLCSFLENMQNLRVFLAVYGV